MNELASSARVYVNLPASMPHDLASYAVKAGAGGRPFAPAHFLRKQGMGKVYKSQAELLREERATKRGLDTIGLWASGKAEPRKGHCAICGRRLKESGGIAETRRTGPRFKNQTWYYCRNCKPQQSKPVEIGRRIG